MKPNADDISIADESQDVFDDDLFDEWLGKSRRAVFKRISSGESVRTEEMIIPVPRSQGRTSIGGRTELPDHRSGLDLGNNQVRCSPEGGAAWDPLEASAPAKRFPDRSFHGSVP